MHPPSAGSRDAAVAHHSSGREGEAAQGASSRRRRRWSVATQRRSPARSPQRHERRAGAARSGRSPAPPPGRSSARRRDARATPADRRPTAAGRCRVAGPKGRRTPGGHALRDRRPIELRSRTPPPRLPRHAVNGVRSKTGRHAAYPRRSTLAKAATPRSPSLLPCAVRLPNARRADVLRVAPQRSRGA